MTVVQHIVFILAVTFCLTFLSGGQALAQHQELQGYWAETQIGYWLEKGVIKGYPDGSFAPDKYITRAEFITMTNNIFSLQGQQEVSFSDVSAGDWFYGEVAKATAAGYLTGYKDNTVRPKQWITREEVAVLLCRLSKLNTDGSNAPASSFLDAADISSWANPGIATAVQYRLMNGYPDGTFRPQDFATRAEALVALDKVFWYINPVLITPM
ncbi:MAG: S-layer homology domain-containing protein [Pelotomaculum sp.]|jgi:hypothetical protein